MKRTLALLLTLLALSTVFVGCNKEEIDEFPVAWEYVTGLPEGFPALCEKLTTVNESYSADKSEIELGWSRVSESDFESYMEKIEQWAGKKFSDWDDSKTATLTADIDGATVTVNAVFNPDASGDYVQGPVYDCQGIIRVISES